MSKQEIIIDDADQKKINSAIARVTKQIEKIQKGYIALVGDIAYLNDMQAHTLNGYKSFYTFCAEKFGIGRTMVYNLLLIYSRYGENYDLTEEAKELSVRQMLSQIKDEKKALETKAENAAPEQGEQEKKKKRKHETILDFNFQNAIEWHGEELLEKLRDEIGETLIIPEGAKIIITITT